MTREEAIEFGKRVLSLSPFEEMREFCERAIKALEQGMVLDKIRAEIVQMLTISFNANDIYKADVLAIIDKYNAESEEV